MTVEDSAHKLSYEAQPIADQIMLRCTCGWRKPICFLDFPLGKSHLLWEKAKQEFEDHIARDKER